MPPSRLVSKPFIAVTAAALAFFTYVGMLVPIVPTFVDDELGAGEIGVGLSLAAFAAAAICARPLIGRLVARYGRRTVMIGGSLLAGFAGFLCSTVHTLGMLLVLRGVAGIGEAALFVAAATLVADLSPPHRRAEAASYFSVAVFGGLGHRSDHRRRRAQRRPVRAGVPRGRVLRLARRVAVARRPRPCRGPRPRRARHRAPRAPRASSASCTRPPSAPVSCWRVASPVSPCSRRSCPQYSKTIGFAGSGGLFAFYSVGVPAAALRRRPLAGAARRAQLGAHRVRHARHRPVDHGRRSRTRGHCGCRPGSSGSPRRSCTRR